ncbi:polyadenylate-binding protein-interacting protein 12 [Manihot esculenta]|uniref:RRM domain-containing protein n=1 Tax=Manihot esculenta TaxID=3983 RepID=A0A251LNA3_MANES|nr:polyadenylate-binding protein-interacting protein 12 [Manihot esculenta]XP_021627169.1 polyadenylate-binding protein-interacting protein 12 [Manihot esculenta]OAY59581.1 hypothetical protein MANES_01G042600v8 [Manihot esculenta]OAY59582.1 hypothetical protein MANES_01G042600v8 [Manihot esculenta]
MAVAENAGAKNGASGQNFDSTVVSSDSKGGPNDLERSKPRNESLVNPKESNFQAQVYDQTVDGEREHRESATAAATLSSGKTNGIQMQNGFDISQQQMVAESAGYETIQIQRAKSNGLNDMSDLVEILSKLNPMAEEFVPPSLVSNHGYLGLGNGFGYTNNFAVQAAPGNANGPTTKRKKNNYNQGRRRVNSRTGMAQRDEVIRRTVYVSDIDQQVTEEQLAGLFVHCGQVVDCRICGDPNSVLRFAFIEFTDEDGARAALNLSGTVLGFYPLRVLPSKTAIAPVNPTFLPRSEDEREMCARTVYCTNIDKKVTQADVRLFFESFCGEVHRLRLLGDYHHSTRIAFVEFTVAESAISALNCSGAVLGSLPIRVSPSKTPVRPRIPRAPLH